MMNLENKIIKNWTDGAVNYSNSVKNELNSEMKQIWTDMILAHAPEKEKLDILDVGTGPGFFAIIMALAGHEITAIDFTEEMLEQAKSNAASEGVKPAFKLSDGHSINAPDASYDLIISRNLTWTLIDAEKAYTEWKRVLRPGGKIIIFDANWNMRYFDKEYMKKHEEDIQNYIEIFNKPVLEYSEAMHDYRKSMPMCSRMRPQWDFDTFIKLGFKKIFCDIDVTEKAWDAEQKVRFRSTPLFMLVVEK